MKSQYYLDTEKYSLRKLKESLKNRDMIPSRIILKKTIEERFRVLDQNGIKTLKELIETLKTKQKIEDFSKKTGLPIDYLTVLKREAGSYLPNPIPLKKLPGIDIKSIEALDKIGIRNTKQFFNEIKKSGIEAISQTSGIAIGELSELASLSDLARLYGVGPVFARMIFDVGITSVERFISYSGEEFIEIYETKTKKKADFGENDINFSIELAKELLDS